MASFSYPNKIVATNNEYATKLQNNIYNKKTNPIRRFVVYSKLVVALYIYLYKKDRIYRSYFFIS